MQLLLAGEHSAEGRIQSNQNCIHFKLVEDDLVDHFVQSDRKLVGCG